MPVGLGRGEAHLRELVTLDLAVRARLLARALWAGSVTTPWRGPGGAFRELRPYRPGDPVRRVDWRASVRTGRWLFKELERTAQLRIVILLDRTSSLAVPEGERLTKAEIAATLAAALSFAALACGHAVALWAESLGPRPRSGPRVRAAILEALRVPAPQPLPPAPEAARLARVADVVLALSDWFDADAPARLGELGLAAARGVDVRALQLLLPEEHDLSLRGVHELRFLDAGERPPLRLDPRSVAAAYREAFQAHQHTLAAAAYRARIPWRGWTLGRDDLVDAARFLATGTAV